MQPSGDTQADTALVEAALKCLKEQQTPFETLFYALSSDRRDLLTPEMAALFAQQRAEPLDQGGLETLLIEEVEALWEPIAARDDWQPLRDKIKRLERLYDLRRAWEAPSVKHMEAPMETPPV